MSQYGEGTDDTFTVSENLTAKQYFLLKIGTSDGAALLNDTKGGYCVGVLQEKIDGSSTVKSARVRIDGVTKISLGGNVARGGEIISDTAGKGIAADAADQFIIGHALESGVDGDIIEMQMTHETSHA